MTFDEWWEQNKCHRDDIDIYMVEKAWKACNKGWIDAIKDASPETDQPFGTTIPLKPEEFKECLDEWLKAERSKK